MCKLNHSHKSAVTLLLKKYLQALLNILATAGDLPLPVRMCKTASYSMMQLKWYNTLQCLWLERANMQSQKWAEWTNVFIMDKNTAHSSHHVMWERWTCTASGQSQKLWTVCFLHIDEFVYISVSVSNLDLTYIYISFIYISHTHRYMHFFTEENSSQAKNFTDLGLSKQICIKFCSCFYWC